MNPDHYEIIKKSAEEWNMWRNDNLDVRPDLSDADLSGLNLFRVNFNDTDLSGANLRGAILISATMNHANLEKANFDGARLQGAQLNMSRMFRASFRQANLTGVVCKGADLMEADLTGADCTGGHFENTNLFETVFYDANVKGANFEGSNVNEAQLFAEPFREATIPLELTAEVEKKQRFLLKYAKTFITIGIGIFISFIFYVTILTAEKPGTWNTRFRARIYLNIAGIYDTFRNYDKALFYLNKSVYYDPNNSRTFYMLGSIYRRKKETRKAIDNFKKFLELEPTAKEAFSIEEYINSASMKLSSEKENKE